MHCHTTLSLSYHQINKGKNVWDYKKSIKELIIKRYREPFLESIDTNFYTEKISKKKIILIIKYFKFI